MGAAGRKSSRVAERLPDPQTGLSASCKFSTVICAAPDCAPRPYASTLERKSRGPDIAEHIDRGSAVAEAGFRGQAAHDVFQDYMEQILNDPAFEGMPDARYEDGRIQWEAPSNRTSGQFKDSHHRRREWWAKKAAGLGISTDQDKWISRVAKAIHPTKHKPCKKCGEWMDIRYVYPNTLTLKALYKLPFIDQDFDSSPIEDIYSLVSRLEARYGRKAIAALPELLRLEGDYPSRMGSLSEWLEWIAETYVPTEPKTLSPGAMSNAPDRFDGFHSFNRCCRAAADTGRSATNLRSYTTDRRVFEYWAAGDWIAADRLMGIVKRDLREEVCLNGHPGPCQADHIGPISLGFNHRPHFQLLCSACNSAKNNRMYPSDVAWLIGQEAKGEEVISWHSKRLWDVCKGRVTTAEHSLRLSKVLRDNRHSYMAALSEIQKAGGLAFLASLLELHHADYDVEFEGLAVKDQITRWAAIRHSPRETKYAAEQKARRYRIAFGELGTYFERSNRNAFVVRTEDTERLLAVSLRSLADIKASTRPLDDAIQAALQSDAAEVGEQFRKIHRDFFNIDNGIFARARHNLAEYMNAVGTEIGNMWDNERYTREL